MKFKLSAPRIILAVLPLLCFFSPPSFAVVDAPSGRFAFADCPPNMQGFFLCAGPITPIPSSSTSSSSAASSSSTSSSSTSSSSTSSTSSSSSSGGTSFAYVVNNASELSAALASVQPGQGILLNNGNYGGLTIGKVWTNYITLQAANKHQAVFESIVLNGANHGYVRFVGIRANDYDIRNNAHHVQILDNSLKSIYFNIADNITIDNTEVLTYLKTTLGTHALLANNVKNFTMTHTILNGARQDLMRITGDSQFITLRKNIFWDSRPQQRPDLGGNGCEYDHTDAIQGFGSGSLNPRDMVIEQNYFYDNPDNNEVRTGCGDGRITLQGVFLSDPKGAGYTNVVVRNNYFYIGSPNTVYINGAGSNVLVENNTLLGWSLINGEPGGGGGSVRVVDKAGYTNAGLTLRYNIARAVSDETTSWAPVPGENFTYSASAVTSFFQLVGAGDTWQDFIPVSGSAAMTFGAFQEILNIQSGATLPPGPRQ